MLVGCRFNMFVQYSFFLSECNSSYRHDDASMISGWWFGTFFIFPYIGNNHPNWLIFCRGVETTNQIYFYTSILVSIAFKIPLQGTFLLLSTWVSPRSPVKLRRIWTFGTEAGIMAMKTWCKGLINRNLYNSTGNTKFFLVLRIPVFLLFFRFAKSSKWRDGQTKVPNRRLL